VPLTQADESIDFTVIRALSGGCPAASSALVVADVHSQHGDMHDATLPVTARECGSLSITLPQVGSRRFEWTAWPSFGLYIGRSEGVWMAVRCGERSSEMENGHTHCDQLGVEVWVEGRRVVGDPGTFTYTADIAARNRYRSASAHFVPHYGSHEPGGPFVDLFSMAPIRAGVSHMDSHSFVGWHEGFGFRVYRSVTLERDKLVVRDYTCGNPIDAPWIPNIGYSPGYGIASEE
jgi:hypothetical protein